MVNYILYNTLVLLVLFVQECVCSCYRNDENCDENFNIWRVWYLWIAIIIIISLCCGGCGAYRRRRLLEANRQTIIVQAQGPVVTGQQPGGVVNYGYNPNIARPQVVTVPMGPPDYAAAISPAGQAAYPQATAPAEHTYTSLVGGPNQPNNKAPSEPPPAYSEAVKQ